MKTTLTTIAVCSLALFASQAYALTPMTDVEAPVKEASLILPSFENTQTPTLNMAGKIGIARIDKGRLIYAPLKELQDWAFLDKRTHMEFAIISPAAHIKNIPEVAFDGKGSVNQIDEIRMTASDLRMDYMIIYGMGDDAQWGSFGGKSMLETGLIANANTISPRGQAKALLINTYSGEIYGTMTSDLTEFGIGDLTDRVHEVVTGLTQDKDSPQDKSVIKA